MTKSRPKNDSRAPSGFWASIVLAALETKRGEEVRLADLYPIVEKMPSVQRRKSNRNVRAKIRQQLQVLRKKELVVQVRKGVWMMPPKA